MDLRALNETVPAPAVPYENQWERVDDFNWLRKQHSPNWESVAAQLRQPTFAVDSSDGHEIKRPVELR